MLVGLKKDYLLLGTYTNLRWYEATKIFFNKFKDNDTLLGGVLIKILNWLKSYT